MTSSFLGVTWQVSLPPMSIQMAIALSLCPLSIPNMAMSTIASSIDWIDAFGVVAAGSPNAWAPNNIEGRAEDMGECYVTP